MRRLIILTPEQLGKLNTKRLLGVLNAARAVRSAEKQRLMMPHVCCEVCMEWMLGPEEWEEKIEKPLAHLTEYVSTIRGILSLRENVK